MRGFRPADASRRHGILRITKSFFTSFLVFLSVKKKKNLIFFFNIIRYSLKRIRDNTIQKNQNNIPEMYMS